MRLIDADEMQEELKDMDIVLAKHNVEDWIDEQPTVDAVEVVRCKDCKHKHINSFAKESMIVYCIHHGVSKQPDDFCSYGERMEPQAEAVEENSFLMQRFMKQE